MSDWKNRLYYGDNLDVLPTFGSAQFDLVYLDPPFDSGRSYNAFFKEEGHLSRAQIRAFEDTWHWGESCESLYESLVNNEERADIAEMVESFVKFLGKKNDVSAYLVHMVPRILELHRVLAPSGSFFLHCNPAAGHYLKVVLDVVFGKRNFVNEIIWSYRRWPSGDRAFQRMHQNIFFYAKDESNEGRVFNTRYEDRSDSTKKRFGEATIVSGWDAGKRVPSETSNDVSPGTPLRDVWDIPRVPPIKMLYETQKPPALLETIIEATTEEGMLVLDPFCGCGTTVVAAQELGRRWVGIDITHLAIRVIEAQLSARFGGAIRKGYDVHGVPRDLEGARDLANRDKLEFQDWALSLVFGRPLADNEKRHTNGGADGLLRFRPRPGTEIERIVLSVKGGEGIHPTDVRDLRGAMESLKAPLGFFITLTDPTDGMYRTAAQCGAYEFSVTSSESVKYPRVQILTIAELLDGKTFRYPGFAVGVPREHLPEQKSDGLF